MKVDPIQLLRLVGGICGVLVLVLGILSLIGSGLSPRQVINGIYLCIFGLLMVISELRIEKVLGHFAFMKHFFGLGMFYIFVGGLCLNSDWWKYALAAALLAVGIVYMFLGCCNRKMGDGNDIKIIYLRKILH